VANTCEADGLRRFDALVLGERRASSLWLLSEAEMVADRQRGGSAGTLAPDGP